MGTMTHAGPIGIDQINHTLYVRNTGELNTIQAAVDYARTAMSGIADVEITHGHNIADNIASVTGGGIDIRIVDQRNTVDQRWSWNGTAYVPQDFVQQTGFVAMGQTAAYDGSLAIGFDATANGGAGSGNLLVTAPNGKPMPWFDLYCQPSDGTALHNFIHCEWNAAKDEPITNINSALIADGPLGCTPNSGAGAQALQSGLVITWNITNQNNETDFINAQEVGAGGGGFSWYNVPPNAEVDSTTPASMWLDGSNNLHVAGSINAPTLAITGAVGFPGGITGPLAVTGNLTASGTATITGDLTTAANLHAVNAILTGSLTAVGATLSGTITASDGEFTTCKVASSPVRTFANTADVPQGMVWPTAGIAVSTGTTWGASINPATLTPYPPAGIPQSTGSAWGASVSLATLATWPASGVPVSTGTAWGTSIAAATLPRLNTPNTFTGAVTAPYFIATGTPASSLTPNSVLTDYVSGAGRLLGCGSGATACTVNISGIDSTGSDYKNYLQGTDAKVTLAGSTASFDFSGNAIFNGNLTTNGTVSSQSSVFLGTATLSVSALNTNVTIPFNTVASVGLLCLRDNSLGGSAVFVLDPNAGAVQVSNQIAGLTVAPAFSGGIWSIHLTSGSVPRSIAWALLGW